MHFIVWKARSASGKFLYERDVLGGQIGVAGGQQVLAVQAGFGGDIGSVDG
ncbi:hypothetical protein [Streptomyces sp. NPDC001435]|uniref:hypothetical protein n=1 Tax=unclassified Streptomyces TaxID=2593676 RepID=UPI0036AAB417